MTTTLHRINDERLAGVLAMLLVIVATAFANFGGSGDNGGAGPYAGGIVVCAGIAALLVGRGLPVAADPPRAAWVLGGLGVLTAPVFWCGLPFAVGDPK